MKISEKHKDFFEAVFEVVKLIPKGRVTSYGAIAKALSTPKASRMVGWAMNASHRSEVPVPAHRVVNRNGVLTGKHNFSDPDEMQRLLEQEGVVVIKDKIQNFNQIFWDPLEEM